MEIGSKFRSYTWSKLIPTQIIYIITLLKTRIMVRIWLCFQKRSSKNLFVCINMNLRKITLLNISSFKLNKQSMRRTSLSSTKPITLILVRVYQWGLALAERVWSSQMVNYGSNFNWEKYLYLVSDYASNIIISSEEYSAWGVHYGKMSPEQTTLLAIKKENIDKVFIWIFP